MRRWHVVPLLLVAGAAALLIATGTRPRATRAQETPAATNDPDDGGRMGSPPLPVEFPTSAPGSDGNGTPFRIYSLWPVSGRVLNEAHEPVAAARVHLVYVSPLSFGYGKLRTVPSVDVLTGELRSVVSVDVQTDAAGRFTLKTPFNSENLYLRAEATGYGQAAFPLLETGPDSIEPVLVVGGQAHVTGEVIDAERNAAMRYHDVLYTFGENGSGGVVETDGDGRFTIPHVPAGPVHVGAIAENRVFVRKSVEVRAGEAAHVTLTLRRGTTCYGVARDADTGAPIPFCYVRLGQWPARTARTDDSGRYEMGGIGADGGWLLFEADLYRVHIEELLPETRTPDRDGRWRLDAVLERAWELTGRVTDERGVPVAWAVVTAITWRHDEPEYCYTDDGGGFTFNHLVPGDGIPTLWIDARGFEELEHEAERRPTKAGSVIDLGELRLKKAAAD